MRTRGEHVEGLPRLLRESAAVLWLGFRRNDEMKEDEPESKDAVWGGDAAGEIQNPSDSYKSGWRVVNETEVSLRFREQRGDKLLQE